MTMANATSSTAHRPSSSASLRKTNKPLMEKRRRARINDSLTQLKSLVIHSSKKDSSQFNKLEKADILELTVKHLRNLQNQQQQQQQMSQGVGQDPNSTGKYRAGFMECANEVIRFLKQSQSFSDDIKTRVIGHLAGCLQMGAQPTYSRPTAAATIVTQTSAAPRLNTAPATAAPSGATTAQLANGQIIQIVNASFQPSQTVMQQVPTAPAAVLVATSVPTATATAVAPAQQQTMAAPMMTSSSPSSRCPPPAPEMTRPSQEHSSYTRYCQPLHIQIPPTLSPVLVKAAEQPQQKQQQQQQPLPLRRNEDHIPPAHQSQQPLQPISPRHNCPSSVPCSSSPIPKDLSPPSKPTYKQLDFYANDIHNDYASRARTFSMTSSSSSSESEMMSPLNLSQSPPFSSYEMNKDVSRPMAKMSTMLDYPSAHSYKHDKVSPPHIPSLRDNAEYSHQSYTSVIVNAKKSLDIPSAKYIRMMMEDERQCVRPQGTPSPASSMGEERLWRPW